MTPGSGRYGVAVVALIQWYCGGERADLALPAIFEGPLQAGHQNLVLGDVDQTLTLQDLVHDRADALPSGELLLTGDAARPLVRLGGGLGRENRVSRPRRQPHLRQEPAHA